MITLQIQNSRGEVRAEESGADAVYLVFQEEYREGDRIVLLCPEPECFLMIHLDDAMHPAYVFLKGGRMELAVPFGEQRASYNPKAFSGALHLLRARPAREWEINGFRNLAQNEYDTHENTSAYPHAHANVETRGEAVFAARNAIDGNTANRSHGLWPYESWGINRNPNAELTLEFGREVDVSRIVLVTRADFPHDNCWRQADVCFSDNSKETLYMEKSSEPHVFPIRERRITWLKLCGLLADPGNPSPFPALSQIEVYGKEVHS